MSEPSRPHTTDRWVLVPTELTPEMIHAARCCLRASEANIRQAWSLMLTEAWGWQRKDRIAMQDDKRALSNRPKPHIMSGNEAPRRIQRQRTKGWRMPDKRRAKYVGRPTRWGNPFKGNDAVDRYRAALDQMGQQQLDAFLTPLFGLDLVCWCPLDRACHADVLLEYANANDGAQNDADLIAEMLARQGEGTASLI